MTRRARRRGRLMVAALLSFAACASSASGVGRVEVQYDHSPSGRHAFLQIERRGGSFVVANHEVPDAHVAALVESLANLHEADGLQSCDHHTDDYPKIRIVLDTGRRNIVLSSTSNCRAMVPWNVVMNGRLYVQYDGAIGRAVGQLMHDLEPSLDILRSSWGPGGIDLAGVEAPAPGVSASTPVRPRLERVVTREPAYGDFFGDGRRIVESHFVCMADDECRKRRADILVAWDSRIQVGFEGRLDAEKVLSLDLDDERQRTFTELRESPLARAMPFDPDYPILVRFYSERCPSLPDSAARGECRAIMMRAGKRDEQWSPQLLRLDYYPALNVVSVRDLRGMDGHDTTPEIIQAFVDLGNDRGLIERALAGREAYFRLDGHLVATVRR